MNGEKTHILYIAEFSTGGSVESLLCLVGGLDKTLYRATVLFYALPDERTCRRFEDAGATIESLFPRSTGQGQAQQFRKLSLQAKVRKVFGQRVERVYESAKYLLQFVRFKLPICRLLTNRIRAIEPDLIHLNNGIGTDTPGIVAARRCRIPAVCHLRTLGNLTYINIAAARKVSKFICISNAVRDAATKQGVDEQRCVVVPNAVDLSRFETSDTGSNDIRAEYGWDESHVLFSLIGRVVAWKGQDDFIRAMAEASKVDNRIRGLVVGDGEDSESGREYCESLRKMVRERGLEDIMKFTGHRTDIPSIMQNSDVVVCPSSLPEPFGRVIIEGMAAGSVVIATNAGGAPDIISDDKTGLLVPVKDHNALAAAMLRVCQDPLLARRLCAAAKSVVRERYTVAKHVESICGIYDTVLHEPQSGP
jgi:glycosyltransferase involved in cell wall biosynthesis